MTMIINHVDKPLITSSSTPLPRRNTSHVSSKFSLSAEVFAPALIQYERDMARQTYDSESLWSPTATCSTLMPIAAQVQRSISDQERPRADSEQMMSALGLDPDLYKVITMTMMKAFAMKYNQTDKTVEIPNIVKSNELRCPWWWWWLKRIFMTIPATMILRVTLVEKKDFLTIILEEFILTFGKFFPYQTFV